MSVNKALADGFANMKSVSRSGFGIESEHKAQTEKVVCSSVGNAERNSDEPRTLPRIRRASFIGPEFAHLSGDAIFEIPHLAAAGCLQSGIELSLGRGRGKKWSP